MFVIVLYFWGSAFGTIQLGLDCDCPVLLDWSLLEVMTSQLLKYGMSCGLSGAKWTVLNEHFTLGGLSITDPGLKSSDLYAG